MRIITNLCRLPLLYWTKIWISLSLTSVDRGLLRGLKVIDTMKNKVINIIRPIDNGAEKEYLKEFFRFIGCFLSDSVVDNKAESSWHRYLKPTNEQGNIDILINYFGTDPYYEECQLRGIKRIYCYFSLEAEYDSVTDRPVVMEKLLRKTTKNKAVQRRTVLNDLVTSIWSEDPDLQQRVRKIVELYTGNSQGDLFYYLQMKRNLRFLSMGEVLSEPNARVAEIRCTPYIHQALEGLWELWVKLDGVTDAYSQYARVKSASTMREIVYKLSRNDHLLLSEITCQGSRFQLPTVEELTDKLRNLIDMHPQFLSAYLSMTGLCRSSLEGDRSEENCYLRVLQSISLERQDYAFIWYRIGYFFEKKHHNQSKALQYYRKTLEVDPEYYQAMFKLGYYAAIQGHFNEAELLLNRAIYIIFRGKSTKVDENEEYIDWLVLSQKESQYAFKAFMLLAKIAIKSNREYSAKAFIGKASMAAQCFERAKLIERSSTFLEFRNFQNYHQMSESVWAMWRILEPWSEGIVQDYHVRQIVRESLARWK